MSMESIKPERDRMKLPVVITVCVGLCISIGLFFIIRGYGTTKTENDFKLLSKEI